jgi:antitoxin VapB
LHYCSTFVLGICRKNIRLHTLHIRPMALHIRDDRAAKLARRLAERKGISMTEAVIDALESALLRGERPLAERLAEIAADARRLGDPRRRRPMTAQDADALWGRP